MPAHDHSPAPFDAAPRPPRWKVVKTAVGWVLGLALLGVAAWFGSQGVDLGAVLHLSPASLVALLALLTVNYAVSTLLFAWMTNALPGVSPRVPMGRMALLTLASGLLNYIPAVRPGLWGRAVYLKKYHRLPVKMSVYTLLVLMGIAVSLLVAEALVLALSRDWSAASRWVTVLCVAALLSVVARVAVRQTPFRGARTAWTWPALRLVDLLATAGRLYVCFAAVGHPIGMLDAMLMASGSLVMRLVNITPNGIGLSEMAVVAINAWLTPVEAAVATAAALIDRTVEAGYTMTGGAVSLWLLKRTLPPPVAAERVPEAAGPPVGPVLTIAGEGPTDPPSPPARDYARAG